MEEKVVKRNIKRPSRKKVCNFCVDKVVEIDYKDVNKLKKFITEKGKIIFGLGCALITMVIRVFGSYPEGVSYSILLMNIITPHINRMVRNKAFGGVQQ